MNETRKFALETALIFMGGPGSGYTYKIEEIIEIAKKIELYVKYVKPDVAKKEQQIS